jgi:protein associated with RNAse G/E
MNSEVVAAECLSEETPVRVEVHSCKYDGRIQRRWEARLRKHAGTLVVLDAAFDEEIRHEHLGTILSGTLSTEYYWTDRWYSVFRFAEPTGALRNFYCNVNTPPVFDGKILSYVDLDIDLLVAPDLSYRVLDEDEFDTNAAHFGYPLEVVTRTHAALEELIELIDRRAFPFDS